MMSEYLQGVLYFYPRTLAAIGAAAVLEVVVYVTKVVL